MPAKTHGLSKKSRLYSIWQSMKARCYAKSRANREGYQKKGIIVCDEWKDDFVAFQSWAMANGYASNLSIDRINNDGNYEPANCRWVTMEQQARNTSSNVWISFNGKTMLLTDWAVQIGISISTLRERLAKYGIEKALSMPKHEWQKVAGPDGVTDTVCGWAKRLGINQNTLRERIEKHGIEKALTMPNGACPPKYIRCGRFVDSISGWSRRLGVAHSTIKNRVALYGKDNAIRRLVMELDS